MTTKDDEWITIHSNLAMAMSISCEMFMLDEIPPYKMNRSWGGETTVVKIAKSPPRGARTPDRAHFIKILALILYEQMIL